MIVIKWLADQIVAESYIRLQIYFRKVIIYYTKFVRYHLSLERSINGYYQ